MAAPSVSSPGVRRGGPARVTAFLEGRECGGGTSGRSPAATAAAGSVLVSVTSLNKSPAEASAEWARNGRACRVRLLQGRQIGGGKRRPIRGFTRAAARRLLFAINSTDSLIHPRERWWFATLTYRVRSLDERPTPAEAKAHLHRFKQELRRTWPGVCGFWKIEPHKSGAPHFHLLLSVPAGVDAVRVHWWLATTWNRIAGKGDPAHLGVHAHADSFQQLRSWEGVSSYSAKYLGKIEDNADPLWQWPGKMWGWVNQPAVVIAVEAQELARPVAVVARRWMGRWFDHQVTGRYRIVDHAGNITRVWRTARAAAALASAGFQVRPYHKRCGKRGGIACFITDATFKRLLSEATNHVSRGPPGRSRGRI